MIDSTRMIDDLYYFDDNLFNNEKAQVFSSISSIFIHEQIRLLTSFFFFLFF